MGNEKSKEKLRGAIHGDVTKMFEAVLDYVQVACPNTETYKVLRAKILRVGNNCIRNLHKELDNYDMEYTNVTEEIIEIVTPKK